MGGKGLHDDQFYKMRVISPFGSFIGWTRPMAQNLYNFISAVSRGEEPEPTLADGLAVQHVLEAAYASCAPPRNVS